MTPSIDRLRPWSRRVAAWLWGLAWPVVGAALLMPVPVASPAGSDVVVHFSLFLGLALWPATFARRAWALAQLALLTAGAGVALEAAHGVLPYRSFEPADLAANLLGVALGLGLALLVLRCLHQRTTAA